MAEAAYESYACPIPGCPVGAVPSRYLMCREHWARVPVLLRTAVWRAYHRYSHRGARSEAVLLDCLAELQAAQRAAIASVVT